ncbi:MAG: cell division protein FtsA [Synergistaceae bacterium]|nr:cell division protein FtsA [Synergistaceae bacterium]
MPERSDGLIVGLSMGTTKTTMIVAKKDRRYPDSVQVIGFGNAPSSGISKGVITSVPNACNSVRRAFEEAQSITGISADRLRSVTVAFNAQEVKSESSHGMITLGDRESRVEEKDLERVIRRAIYDLPKRGNMSPIHRIPMNYELDGVPVSDPLNMNGNKLDIWLQTVSVPMTYEQTVRNCVQTAGLDVKGLVLKPLASSLGAVYEEEMRLGCISICIGGGTTGIVLYRGGRAFRVLSIPIGGDHIKSDLATVLHISFGEAEHLKKRIFTTSEDDLRREGIDVDLAYQIIFARIEELFNDYIRIALAECTPQNYPGGIILSGGVSDTPGLEMMLGDVLQMPIRKAEEPVYRMPPGLDNAAYVSAAGILKYHVLTERDKYLFMSEDERFENRDIQTQTRAQERVREREQPVGYDEPPYDGDDQDYDDSGDEYEDDGYDDDEDGTSKRKNFGEIMVRLADRFKKLF